MGDSEMAQIGRLQADVKNICRSMDEMKGDIKEIKAALNDHRVISAERAQRIDNTARRVDEHEGRLKKLEASFAKLAVIAALSAGGATLTIDKIINLLK